MDKFESLSKLTQAEAENDCGIQKQVRQLKELGFNAENVVKVILEILRK
jgi:hypothetical protein